MKKIKKRAKKVKKAKLFNKLPIAILAGGLIGIGLFPFHAIKKRIEKKRSKKVKTA